MDETNSPASLVEFCTHLRTCLFDGSAPIDLDAWDRSTELGALGLDSFDMFRLLIAVEDLADYFVVDMSVVAPPRTIGDAYDSYLALLDVRHDALGF